MCGFGVQLLVLDMRMFHSTMPTRNTPSERQRLKTTGVMRTISPPPTLILIPSLELYRGYIGIMEKKMETTMMG